MKTFYLLFSCIFLWSQASQAQKLFANVKFGKGVSCVSPDSSMSLKFGARFQTLFEAQKTLNDNSNFEKKMQIRRFRLKFDGFAFTPKLIYKIELALSNSDNAAANVRQQGNASNIVLDAILKYSLRNNLEVWFGQAKLPGNRERIISSQALQFVDRSRVNAFYNLDRDLGVQVHHQFNIGKAVFRDRYAISLGQGRNVTAPDTGGFSYTGRFEFLPFGEFTADGDYVDSDLLREPKPKVSFGAGYSYNDNAVRSNGELGSFLMESRDLKTFFADLMLKYKGWSLTSEYMDKQADKNPLLADSSDYFQTGNGWNIQTGYLFKNNFEVAARYTQINPSSRIINADMDNSINEYTFGVSRYIVGHSLKIQSDLSYIDTKGIPDGDIRFRFQIEMAF